MEQLLSPTWNDRVFIVCSHIDPDYVQGHYEKVLASSAFANKVLAGPDGANNVSYFIDCVCAKGRPYIRLDDNITRFQISDLAEMKLMNATEDPALFRKFLQPTAKALNGAMAWGCTNRHACQEFAGPAARTTDQFEM